VFNRTVFEHLYMVPLLFNVMNACKSGIREYTDTTKRTQRYSGLLKRPIIMHHIYRLGIKYYLHNYGYDAEQEFSQRIYRSPPRDLLEIFASEFPKKFLFECFTKISKLDEKTSDDERAPELHRKKTQAKREAIFEGVERDLKLQKVTLPFN
jgi:hypothetical protein